MIAFKFLTADNRSGQGNEYPWNEGETRSINLAWNIICCNTGYHFCTSFRDALPYAPGTVAAVGDVRGDSDTDHKGDKTAYRTATMRQMVDVRGVLIQFAQDCATHVDPISHGHSDQAEMARGAQRSADCAAECARGSDAVQYVTQAAKRALLAHQSDADKAAERAWQTERLQNLIERAIKDALIAQVLNRTTEEE